MKRDLSIAVCAVVFAAILAGAYGCAPQAQEPSATTSAPTTTESTSAAPPEESTTPIRVYFTRGEKIGVGGRQLESGTGIREQVRAAVQALLDGPTAEEKKFGLGTTIPANTRLNTVVLSGGVASVDLSPEFVSGGGSLSMLLRATQVVCTVTQFNGIERVAFYINGKYQKALGGEGIIVDPPVGRKDFEGQLPAILVENPYAGETLTSPVTVTGSSNVFEAVHQLQLTDAAGTVLYNEPVQATSGTGERGTWFATIDYATPKEGLGTITVFEKSPKDGKRTNVVRIPVRLSQ